MPFFRIYVLGRPTLLFFSFSAKGSQSFLSSPASSREWADCAKRLNERYLLPLLSNHSDHLLFQLALLSRSFFTFPFRFDIFVSFRTIYIYISSCSFARSIEIRYKSARFSKCLQPASLSRSSFLFDSRFRHHFSCSPSGLFQWKQYMYISNPVLRLISQVAGSIEIRYKSARFYTGDKSGIA